MNLDTKLMAATLVLSAASVAENAALLSRSPPRVLHAAAPVVSSAPADPCAELGVTFSMYGHTVRVPANVAGDNAGHKYRKDGSRFTWFTVHGPIYVHAVGGALPGDTGKSELSLLTIGVGKGRAYERSPMTSSTLDVTIADSTKIGGRFEADVTSVTSTAENNVSPAHVTGTFCLPALPANPGDTGP